MVTDNRFRLAQAMPARQGGRIPVTVLTGFLGAGKTTLLNRLVTRPEMADVAVFINELGDVGIDHHLVERIDDALVILDSGCLCCTVQGDLMAALMALHARIARREIAPVSRVLIETSGLADPGPVLRALMEDRQVAGRFRCDGVLTVVDTTRLRAQIARHREAVVQIGMADRLLLSKTDLAGAVEQRAVEQALTGLNPTAKRVDLGAGELAPAELFSSGLYSAEQAETSLDGWLGLGTLAGAKQRRMASAAALAGATGPAHRPPAASELTATHSGRVRSFVVRFDTPPGWRGLAVGLGEILAEYAGRLLRVKGLVALPGLEVPMALHCVEDVAYAPVRLAAWPTTGPLADGHGRLVFIGEALDDADEAEIRARLARLPGDRDALRRAAALPGLATRSWLRERAPLTPRPGLSVAGFVVQPRFLGERRGDV